MDQLSNNYQTMLNSPKISGENADMRNKLMQAYMNKMKQSQIMAPIAQGIDLLSRSYTGLPQGQGQQPAISAMVEKPSTNELANMIGWISKENGNQPSELELVKLKMAEDRAKLNEQRSSIKDSLDERKLRMAVSSKVDNQFKEVVPAKEVTTFNNRVNSLREALEDGDVAKVEGVLTQYIKMMEDSGNVAVKEREMTFLRPISAMFEKIKRKAGAEGRYDEKTLRPLIDIVNSQIRGRKIKYLADIEGVTDSIMSDPTYLDYPDVVLAQAKKRLSLFDSIGGEIKYRGTRKQDDTETTSDTVRKFTRVNGKLVEVKE